MTSHAAHPVEPPDPRSLSDPERVLEVILDPRQRGELYPYLARLQALAPRHRSSALHGRPAWILTRFDDALEVLSNKSLVSDARNAEIFDSGPGGRVFYDMVRRLLLYVGPEAHTRIRSVVARHFTPRAVARYRPLMQQVVDGLLDRAAEMGRVDLVGDLAYALPTAVICEILGVPREDLPVFHGWLGDFARRGDVSGITPEVEQRGEDATQGFAGYFEALIDARRRQPREDLMTLLVVSADEGGEISDDELVALCILMIQAGHETTADMIALGMLALLRAPDQLALLQQDPGLVPGAIEELLRYDGSNQLVQRVSEDDFELRGLRVRAGEVCSILTGAAGRDPARYADPDRLDVRRNDIQHFGFGHGSHACLGAALARNELAIMLGSLIARFPHMALASDEVEYRDSLVLRGLRRLDLSL